MVDVGHHQRQRLVLGGGVGDRLFQRGVEELAVGELGERIGQAFGAHRFEIDLQIVDFLLGGVEPLFQLLVGDFHLLGGLHQALDDGAQALAVLGVTELLGHVGKVLGVVVGAPSGGVDHRHDLLDLAHHLAADSVDALGEPSRRQVSLVNLLELGVGKLAAIAEQLIDFLIERGVIAGGVSVPDFVIARRCLLAQGLDLPKGNLRERHGAFVIVDMPGHRLTPVRRRSAWTTLECAAGRPRCSLGEGIMGR